MRSTLLLTVLSAALAVGCSRNIDVGDDTGTDDTGTDDTGNDDTDTSTTTDTDTGGGDTATTGLVDCQADYQTPAPVGGTGDDACHTAEISCGDTVFGSTEGGSTWYDVDQYETWFCWGINEESTFSGPERVYPLDVPASTHVTITLESPCADLALRYARTGNRDCPDESVILGDCDPDTPEGDTQELKFNTTGDPLHYEIIVDSRGTTGNFAFTVECD